jgi:hypothetical protein
MKNYHFLLFILSFPIFLFQCKSDPSTTQGATPADAIDTTDIHYFLSELSSDKFLGRKPCSEGEPITINFIKNEFQKMGLEPGNGDSYFQKVPLVDIEAAPSDGMFIEGGKQDLSLAYKKTS